MQNSNWLLHYWVHGSPLHDLRAIEAPPSTTIGTVKQLIASESVPPLSITAIYRVPEDKPVPDDDSLKEGLGNLTFSVLGKPLRPVQKLSSVFVTSPPDNHLHLVVDVPVLEVRCWIRGTGSESSFPVVTSKVGTVDNLKKVIKADEPALAGVSVSRLRLYKISTTNTNELTDILGGIGMGQFLGGGESLETVFSDVPFSEIPRVVVEWSNDTAPTVEPSVMLNCWVYGQLICSIFPVEISSMKTVGVLREVIKEKKSVVFHDVEADSLVLYKVSIANGENLEETLKNLAFDREELGPLDLLSRVFSDSPQADHVHIIVLAPPPSTYAGYSHYPLLQNSVAAKRRAFIENYFKD